MTTSLHQQLIFEKLEYYLTTPTTTRHSGSPAIIPLLDVLSPLMYRECGRFVIGICRFEVVYSICFKLWVQTNFLYTICTLMCSVYVTQSLLFMSWVIDCSISAFAEKIGRNEFRLRILSFSDKYLSGLDLNIAVTFCVICDWLLY